MQYLTPRIGSPTARIAVGALLVGWAIAWASTASAAVRLSDLARMAADADLVAVVRVEQTAYAKTRDFPSSGSAFLQILIPYKGAERDQIIEVTEKGLAENACYYPDPGVWRFEGDRFLVLLKKSGDGKDTYRGRGPTCRLPVLVTDDNRYAVRFPVDGLEVEDPEAVVPLTYTDPAAFIDAADFTRAQLRDLIDNYRARKVEVEDPLAPPQALYIYTLGIPLSRMREILFPGLGPSPASQ